MPIVNLTVLCATILWTVVQNAAFTEVTLLT